MDNKFEKIIEYKKLKSSVRKPKYATRKLSIGLVSCMLGYALLVSPSSVEAAELESNTQAIEETAENESYVDTTNDTIDETSTVETGEDDEAATEETNEANNLSVTEKTKEKEDVSLKEAVHAKTNEENLNSEDADTEKSEEENKDSSEKKLVEKFTLSQEQKQALKDAGYTDNEIANIEEGVANKLSEDANFDADAFLTQKVSEKASELEIDEEAKPEAVAAGDETEAGRDISNDITEAEIHVGNTQTPGVLKAGDGEGLAWSVAFKAPDGTKAGDYFDITLSDNWTLKGIEPDTEDANPIEINGNIVADGKRLSRQQIRYTFNDNIKDLEEIRVAVQYGGYDVKEKVQDSKTQTFTISVGDHYDSKDLYVDYGQVRYDDYEKVLNGTSQYTHFDPKTGDFTQVFYINPDSRYIGRSTGENFNGSVGVILDGRGFDGTQSDVYFTPENTKLDIVKLAPRTKVPGAVYENPVNGEVDQSINPVIQGGKVFMDFNRDGIDNPYIITVKSKFDPNVKYINLGSRATLYGNGYLDLGLINQIQFETGNTDVSGEEEPGSFQEHHIYITKDEDGNIIDEKTITEDGEVKEGNKDEIYPTGKIEKDGYTFVKAENPVNEPTYNENGEPTEGNYKPGEKQEITYVYEKTITTKGSFQDHHIYQTVDKNGNVITTDAEEDGKEQTGKEEESYKTSKVDKEGYKLVEVKPTNAKSQELGVKYDSENGELTEGNYVAGEKQEVTYIYQKTEENPVEEKGSFQEHHIYITKDKDGKEISRDEVPGELQEGKEDESYTTGKKEKDGFKFVRTENPVENPTYDEEGRTTKGNYRPGVKQEITYVYERTETPWTPLEPSEPVEPETPDETPDIPWTPLEPSEPVEPETPGETPDIPWTPLEPSEPVEPETPETPENPEKPETPETPDKAEKPGKSETSEDNKDKKDNKVQVPVVEANKEAKKETPVRKNGNPKTGVGSISGAALGLIAAASGLFVSKKNKDEE